MLKDKIYYLLIYNLKKKRNFIVGVVAHMVERMLSMHEARGSMPFYSRFCFFINICLYLTSNNLENYLIKSNYIFYLVIEVNSNNYLFKF